MLIENMPVLSHEPLCGAYRTLMLASEKIARQVKPGQFVHVRVPRLAEAVLRRPFSVFKADERSLTILYKTVGVGTRAMSVLRPNDVLNVMGPLGNGFPALQKGAFPLLVAGGYGIAALRLLAERSSAKGIIFMGGASAADIICVDEFQKLGWETRIATEDGSLGKQGLVTTIIDDWLENEMGGRVPEFFACGPNGMLKAVADCAVVGEWNAWLSFERHMGCGVGACLACVQRLKKDSSHRWMKGQPRSAKWGWARVCKEGPVFECHELAREDYD